MGAGALMAVGLATVTVEPCTAVGACTCTCGNERRFGAADHSLVCHLDRCLKLQSVGAVLRLCWQEALSWDSLAVQAS